MRVRAYTTKFEIDFGTLNNTLSQYTYCRCMPRSPYAMDMYMQQTNGIRLAHTFSVCVCSPLDCGDGVPGVSVNIFGLLCAGDALHATFDTMPFDRIDAWLA